MSARSWLSDTAGATAVEFALVAPVLLMTVMGLFDLAYNMYTMSMLQGAIQQAARGATLEGAAPAQLDAIVTRAVRAISPNATLAFNRKSYASFADVGRPEDYNDIDGSNACDNGEPFEDANHNGVWDADRGSAGQGGARDAVLYTVNVTYPRAFPISGLAGMPSNFTTTAKSVLRNQPYGLQQEAAPATGNCP